MKHNNNNSNNLAYFEPVSQTDFRDAWTFIQFSQLP